MMKPLLFKKQKSPKYTLSYKCDRSPLSVYTAICLRCLPDKNALVYFSQVRCRGDRALLFSFSTCCCRFFFFISCFRCGF